MSQTTMKIDRDLLADLKKISTEAYRSPQQHLRYLVDRDMGVSRADNDETDVFIEMMDTLVYNSENNIVTEVERAFTQELLDSGVALFGDDENGNFTQYAGTN